jgi:hypothetical protein
MAYFYEELLHEYPEIPKKKTFSKTTSYRIRVLKRKIEGIPRVLLDMREYIITEKRAMLLETGFYFTLEEVKVLIPILQDSLKYFYRRPNEPGAGD